MSRATPWRVVAVVVGSAALIMGAVLFSARRAPQTSTEPPPGSAAISKGARPSRATAVVMAEWGIAGEKSTQSDPFTLGAEPTVFEMQCECQGTFRVRLVSADRKTVMPLAEASGTVSTSKTVAGEAPGQYTLEIEADGVWEITVRPETEEHVEQKR